MQHVLWGKDHTELGAVAVEAVGANVAVAISRGLHRKTYRYTDPNEDAVAAVVGRQATLLVVADGHNGWPSAEAAVAEILRVLGDDPPASIDVQEMRDLFWQAHLAILDVTQSTDSSTPESRTTLVVALVTEEDVHWASMGDSAVYVATPAGGGAINEGGRYFLGYRHMPYPALTTVLEQGVHRLGEGQAVVLASDGFSDFAHPFPTQVFASTEPAVVARGLVTAAFRGGAGDNVAVAVAVPQPGGPPS